MKKYYLIVALMLFVGISACKRPNFKQVASTAWNPNLAIPIGYGTFDIYDIFQYHDTSDLVVIDENTGLIALVYESDLTVANASDFVTLGQLDADINLDGSTLNLPSLGSLNGSLTLNNTENFTVDVPAGVEIYNFEMKSGTMTITVSTNLQHDVTSVITLPGLTINGNPVQQTIQLNYQGSTPHSGSAVFNLGGALMDCTLGNTTVNTLEAEMENTLTGTGAPINGNEFINVNFSTQNMAFKLANGYFGQQSIIDLEDSLLIRIFENGQGGGYFELVNPSLRLKVKSSMGVPVTFDISELRTINAYNNQEFNMAGYPDIHAINAPSDPSQVAETEIEFNVSNTPNLANVIAPVPQYLAFAVSALTNPDGPSANLNFISDTSSVKVNTQLEMPLEGFAHSYSASDTFNFNLGVDAQEIESVMFRLIIDNEFPVEMMTQLRFMDENYNVLFTGWDQPVLGVDHAEVNADGVVVERKIKITDLVIDQENLDILPEVAYIEVVGMAQTTDGMQGTVIKIFDWYDVQIKLAMQIQAKIKF